MKPAFIWWDEDTVLNSTLVSSLKIRMTGINEWTIAIKIAGEEGEYSKRFDNEEEAREEYNVLFSDLKGAAS